MSDWAPDIARLQALNNDEWLRVESTFCGRLLAYAARRVPDAQAREDIVQETFLGALRGIDNFDAVYSFEQYLFGICRNRTIDFLRRRRVVGQGQEADSRDAPLAVDQLLFEGTTPSGIVQTADAADRGRELLVGVLRQWVQETWQQGEFVRLQVIEALFSGGWRNRDTWQRFGLRDETAVAGVKFRALKRLRHLAEASDASGEILAALAAVSEEEKSHFDFDVAVTWRLGRVSCPARYWLTRHLAGDLKGAPEEFVKFHLEEMKCPWCAANLDDLERAEEDSLTPFLESLRQSTVQYLRSRSISGEGS
ncbi:MAG: sigma-70 family RNA polymerase sigma factor [bacterium]|nr:sigma-70 family RNA polymerase sigma factor [Planctomycetota bacterium]HIL53237.1 sigma-70 family RNA polymerase sigma factor [Planctomycetota bacterium]